jgi:hypothetical protein
MIFCEAGRPSVKDTNTGDGDRGTGTNRELPPNGEIKIWVSPQTATGEVKDGISSDRSPDERGYCQEDCQHQRSVSGH